MLPFSYLNWAILSEQACETDPSLSGTQLFKRHITSIFPWSMDFYWYFGNFEIAHLRHKKCWSMFLFAIVLWCNCFLYFKLWSLLDGRWAKWRTPLLGKEVSILFLARNCLTFLHFRWSRQKRLWNQSLNRSVSFQSFQSKTISVFLPRTKTNISSCKKANRKWK